MTESDMPKDLDGLKADFAQMRRDLANLVTSIGDMASQGAGGHLDDLKEAGRSARYRLHAVGEDADSLCRTGASALEHQVEAHPLVTIAAAFGIGLVVGKLVHRK